MAGAYSGYQLAADRGLNLWTGVGRFDLSQGYAASGNYEIGKKTITGKWVDKFEGVNVYESKMLAEGSAASLPGRGIIFRKGEYRPNLRSVQELLQHEYGHILQAEMVGYKAFYQVIAPESLGSATMSGISDWSHNDFWTETWANYLSHSYFGDRSLLNTPRWPIKDISKFNLIRLRVVSPFFLP